MKTFFLFALLLLHRNSFAQSFAVAADKMKIAYIGIYNPLSIVSGNCSCKDIFATTDNGTLTKKDSCHFTYQPERQGRATIIIQKKQNGKLIKIGEQSLKCKRIPDPRVAIGNKSSGVIPVEQFKVQQGISVVFDSGFEMDLKFTVTSFTIVMIYKNAPVYSEATVGNRFTAKTIAQINLLKPGDELFVENIDSLDRFVIQDGSFFRDKTSCTNSDTIASASS